MRILAGKYKGRKLKSFDQPTIRPTCGLIKESFFNSCAFDIEGACFLDVFAGIGSIGFEALSRGAQEVCFIDSSVAAVKLIRANAALLDVNAYIKVIKGDALKSIVRISKMKSFFNIIYLDPPYDLDNNYVVQVLESIRDHSLLSDDGRLFLENKTSLSFEIKDFQICRRRRLGEIFLTEYIKDKKSL